MPLYEYRCPVCQHVSEHLRKLGERGDSAPCLRCGGEAAPIFSLIARTPGRWGDTNGGYSAALGTHYTTTADLERKAEAAGAVHLDDLGGTNALMDSVAADADVGSGLPSLRDSMIEAADAIHAAGHKPTFDGVPISSPADLA